MVLFTGDQKLPTILKSYVDIARYMMRSFWLSADKKYEAIILPLAGMSVPFHISTVKVIVISILIF